MNRKKGIHILRMCLIVLLSNLANAGNEQLEFKKDESPFHYKISGKLKTADTYYGKNISLLNDAIDHDRVFFQKNNLDVSADLGIRDFIDARFSMRTKATWGSPEIAPTTTTPTKLGDAVAQNHKHFMARHLFWMKEAWIKFSLNEALGLHSMKKQTFTLGAFPFQLGRGIALGDAFAVSPNYLGFFSDSAVDQYAFGMKLSGDIVDEKLSYDLYGGILDNKSNSLSRTGRKILGQEYGKLSCPERGFGKVAYIIAGRLNIKPIDDKEHGKLTFEPYFLYHSDKEQQVEFLADATTRLGTIGVATEYISDRFEFGFDMAGNLGHQCVKGWDRNQIEVQNRNGTIQLVNSHVYTNINPLATDDATAAVTNYSPYKAPYVATGIETATGIVNSAGSTANGLINNAVQAEGQNGKLIGVATDLNLVSTIPTTVGTVDENTLYNATNRFRDPYRTEYKGWMLVSDAAAYTENKEFMFAVTAAYVSGDQDPNFTLKDGDYRGFVSLQELYAGKRVKSAFFLGGEGKLSLPLDIPASEKQPNRFGSLTSGLTNLSFIGAGVTWKPQDWEKTFTLNPNILAYWEPYPDRKFDLTTKQTLAQQASSFLGIELNVYLKKELMKNLNLYGIVSVFIPGSHFDDVRGKPLNAAQWKILDRFDVTGYNGDSAPGLGTNSSFTFNFGFEYLF